MTSFWLDLRHAARVLVKQAGVTSIAILTLGLGIGATTAIFSVVYGVLLRPLPYPRPDRLAAIWEVNHRGTRSRLADPNFDDFRDRNRTFTVMAKYTEWVTSIAGAGEPTRTTVAAVTKDFFTVIGVQPAVGRGLAAEDAHPGAEPVVIVSHRYWTGALGSSQPLSATHLRIEDRVYTLVGVMPAGFQFPANVDVWRPAELDPENTSRTSHNYHAIGRLRDGVTVARASADLNAIASDVIRHSPEQGEYLLAGAEAIPLQASLTGRVGSALYILLGAVFFLLLVACANVTNLLLAQAAARQREFAVRHALGAGRGRIARQFVAEALVLAAAGCLAGLAIAWLGMSGLLAVAPADLPRLDEVSLNWAVLGFAAGLSGLVALALGLLTAWRATRRDPREALLDAGRGQAGTGSSQRIGRVIVAMQLATTVVLLVGAALLGRSLLRVLSVDPGFRTDHVVTMDLAMPSSDDPAARERLRPFYADTLGRLRAIPGVDEVAAASAVPLDGGLPDGMFLHLAPGDAPRSLDDLLLRFRRKDRAGTADYCAASPGYFHTLGIPLVRGRLFDEGDGPDRPHVAVVNESLARTRVAGRGSESAGRSSSATWTATCGPSRSSGSSATRGSTASSSRRGRRCTWISCSARDSRPPSSCGPAPIPGP